MPKRTLAGSYQNAVLFFYENYQITVSSSRDQDGGWSSSFSATDLKPRRVDPPMRGIHGIAMGQFSSASDAVASAKEQCERWIDRVRAQQAANVVKNIR